MALASYTKQPGETLDYDIDFQEQWLSVINDTISSFTVTSDAGITVVSSFLLGGIVKVFVSGGLDGQTYKVTVRVTTTGGRIREADIKIKVKEL